MVPQSLSAGNPIVGTIEGERLHRARVIGFAGAAVSFLVSQIGLLWVLATGGVGPSPSVAATVWLFSTLLAGLFLLLVSDSYRRQPRWLRPGPASTTA